MYLVSPLLFSLPCVLSSPGKITLLKDRMSNSLLLPVVINEGVNMRRNLKETNLLKKSGACAFYTYGFYVEGLCTHYGSCRVARADYMYKGGCGELARWGEKSIEEQKVWRNHLSKHILFS